MCRLEVGDERPGERAAVAVDERRRRVRAGQPEQAHEHEERDRLDEDQRDEGPRVRELRQLRPQRTRERPPSHCSPRDWKTSTMSGARTRTLATPSVSSAALVTACGETPWTTCTVSPMSLVSTRKTPSSPRTRSATAVATPSTQSISTQRPVR